MRMKFLVLGLIMTVLAGCGLQPTLEATQVNSRATTTARSTFDETVYKEVSYKGTRHSLRAFMDRFQPGQHFQVTGKLSYYKGWGDLLGNKPSGFGMVIGETGDYANLILEARWHDDEAVTKKWLESLGAKPYQGGPDFSGETVTVYLTFDRQAPAASQIRLDAVKRNGKVTRVTMPTPLK